eukprot:TRINITY_DN744_c0_g1_i11.p1 TRINITY_DN744_c0_g1~~TRINITY_DN744_c0_g1_i11.p1  ORF type:complete len:198 (+),score=43.33 TRINITY_DN744_c0_g1_i11:766-1359(+)
MKLSSPRGNLASASLDDSVFFAGGEYFSNLHGLISSPVVDLYNLSTGEWSQFSLSFPRTNLAAASRGTKVLFAGGEIKDGGPKPIISDRVDIYDVVKRTWNVDRLSVPRTGLASAAWGNFIVFAGGNAPVRSTPQRSSPSSVIDIYNVRTERWSSTTMSEARCWLSATALNGNFFFGFGQRDLTTSNSVDIFQCFGD